MARPPERRDAGNGPSCRRFRFPKRGSTVFIQAQNVSRAHSRGGVLALQQRIGERGQLAAACTRLDHDNLGDRWHDLSDDVPMAGRSWFANVSCRF